MLRQAEGTLAAHVERDVTHGLELGPAEAARRAAAAMDQALARVMTEGSTGASVACAPGCAFCCHVHVDVTEAELGAIVEYLEETLSEAARLDLVSELEQQVARTGPLDAVERWASRIPCALLADDGRCSIYAARPLRCRAFHSTSADACRRAEEDPEPLRALDRACDAVERGFESALASAGEESRPLLLEAALLAALKA